MRVELWGDDVEEIRSFSVADQRTLDKVERLWAPPCRELLLTDEVRRRAAELGAQHPQLLELTDKIAAGIAVEGMESLAPVLVDEMELLVDLMPADTHVLVLDPERARSRAHDLVATSEEFLGASWAAAAGGGTAPIDLGAASYRVPRRRPPAHPRPRQALVDPQPVRPRRRGSPGRNRRSNRPTHRRIVRDYRTGRSTTTAATWRRRSRTWRGGGPTGTGRWCSTPGTGRPSGWSRCWGSTTCRPGWSRRSRPASRRRRRGHLRLAHQRLRRRHQPDRAAHRRGHLRPARLDPRHAEDAGPAQAADRPARADRRRLHRARAARRRPVRGDEAARGAGRDARVPRARVRPVEARRPAGPAVRAGRRARPGDPLRRRRAAQPRPARRRRLGQAQGPRPQGGPRDRGRADQAVRRPPGHQGLRVRAGHALAARARGRLPVHRDARPADHGRRGQVRHAADRADGPAGLRRRRLRQDRDRGAGGVQGGAGRQAGSSAGADHAAGHPAPQHVQRADERLPGRREGR